MTATGHWTSADLEGLPDDGSLYEIIGGELYVSKQPHLRHQDVCGEIYASLREWSRQTGAGRAYMAPGLIFADDDDVAPDLVWVSMTRLAEIVFADGKLHGPPELVVEVLSLGAANQRRDREAKLALYSRRGVGEYWIADWRKKLVEVYRPEEGSLRKVAVLGDTDQIASPLLPGFSYPVADFFG
jgi:Uma2 family endonuclease